MQLNIYFHRDFDGMAGAALLSEVFRTCRGFETFAYHPVDFHLKDEWLDMRLAQPAAVLDFFYHPDATYYYDHHDSPIAERFFGAPQLDELDRCLLLAMKSTPSILRYKFGDRFDFGRYAELVRWSDIIDNCEYASPRDLYESEEPYIRLNKLICYFQDRNMDDEIIRLVSSMLREPEEALRERAELVELLIDEEREVARRLAETIEVEGAIGFIDQSESGFAVQRFISYCYYPDLDYQVMIYRKNDAYLVNVGRNAWKSFDSRNLGEIASKLGGFGRKDAGGIFVRTHAEALALAAVIRRELTEDSSSESLF
ncbi:hypothetical protein [Paenibacillus methanolicus]|uniref:NanoRNase/pAp phosphatase (C-di-AMP/oligoRNAs hydrolase) n=1 Tax=Paenibacillus methanolicus TaxID=582686 RepID=A0A5S5BYW7_9BACL|nr:hypothetical protein [Paenibacillus methanolicus]TYP72371.1 hypothetical protein BCM02_10825 [Paenibacillus methanolicus]